MKASHFDLGMGKSEKIEVEFCQPLHRAQSVTNFNFEEAKKRLG
jgi:hypothetical protein